MSQDQSMGKTYFIFYFDFIMLVLSVYLNFQNSFTYFRNNNAPFVLPPGMSVEDKTKFLSNLDKDHQAFVSMPHMNAGKKYNLMSILC